MPIYEITHNDHLGRIVLDGVRATYEEAAARCEYFRNQDTRRGNRPNLYKVTMTASTPQLTH